MADTITVTGVVGTEPQLGDAAGTPVCNFRLASSLRRYDKQTGTWSEYGTNWYSVGAYRYLGTNVAASVHKGDHVVVTGRVRLREWSNQGGKGMTVDIDATSVGHDLSWGTTAFSRHKDADAAMPRTDDADVGEDDASSPVPDSATGSLVSDTASPLAEAAAPLAHNGWGDVGVRSENHDAA